MGFFSKLKEGLKKTKDSMVKKMQKVVNSFTKIDEELFESLEETMIMSDMGVETSEEICQRLRKRVKEEGVTDPSLIMGLIQDIIREMLGTDTELDINCSSPERVSSSNNNSFSLFLILMTKFAYSCCFSCTVYTYYHNNGREHHAEGKCEGKIGREEKGNNGFGYDPIFVVGNRTLAELEEAEKNQISHRAEALKKMKEILKQF